MRYCFQFDPDANGNAVLWFSSCWFALALFLLILMIFWFVVCCLCEFGTLSSEFHLQR
eukprot:m.331963 g.331963  ORF g.331963 m.331963 type:complete len:58 (-) comp55629_c1_seq1:87-260(-)